MATPEAKYRITAQDKSKKALNSAGKGLKGLEQMAKRVGGVLIAALGARAMFQAGKEALDFAEKVGQLSTRLGISVEALSQLKFAADVTGVSFNKLVMGLQRMTRRVAEAAVGTGEAQAAIKELGLDAEKLNRLRPEQQFEVLADALNGVTDSGHKVRLAMKLFDSEGVAMLQTMEGGAPKIKALRAEADKLGLTLTESMVKKASDANHALTSLQGATTGLTQQLAIQLGPAIADIANFMATHLNTVIRAISGTFNGLRFVIISFVQASVGALQLLFEFIGKLPESWIGAQAKQAAESLKGVYSSLEITKNKFKAATIEARAFRSELAALPGSGGSASGGGGTGGATGGASGVALDEGVTLAMRQAFLRSLKLAEGLKAEMERAATMKNGIQETLANAIMVGSQNGAKSMVDMLIQGLKTRFAQQAAGIIAGALGNMFGGSKAGGGGFFGKLFGFDKGGVVPGPRGQPQLAVVEGGETILPTHKGRGGGGNGGVTIIQHNTFNTSSGSAAEIQGMLVANKRETLAAVQNQNRRRRAIRV